MPGWRGRSSKRSRSSPRPGPNAAPWSKRHRSCGRASSPTWHVAGGCCTARSSSCAPGASVWPRRSATSGRQSTRSPTSCSGPRTKHGWPQKPPDGRPREGELSDATTIDVSGDDGVGDLTGRGEGSDTKQSVEELFARLRAEAGSVTNPDEETVVVASIESTASSTVSGDSDEVIESVRILSATRAAPSPSAAGGTDDASAEGQAPSGSPAKATARGKPAADRGAKPGPGPTSAASGPSTEAPVRGGKSQDSTSAPEAGGPDSESEEPDTALVDPLVAQRDEVLTPLVSNLACRLKRALQDDQNDILDRLRAKGGWAPGVLLPEEDHAQRYVQAASDQLTEASRSGATFAGGKADEAPGIDDVATSMAAEIVAPLRRRLEDAGPSVDEGDESALVELVGAAFREWKGARTERLAGDQTVFAFARAALAAVPEGTMLRWVVEDDVAECPDCDDNALAGPVAAGEEFPTGHPHPPAHAGCRCLLAPANA